MLQTFAAQGGAPGRRPQQETPGALVGGGPDQITDTLETEHRVVDIKRQHAQAVDRVAGCRRHPGADGAGLADTFFEYLPVGGFAVTEDRANIFRLIALADTGIDADLAKQIGHAEGACLVGDDGDNARPQLFVFEQIAEHAYKGHGGGHFLAIGLRCKPTVAVDGGNRHHRCITVAHRQAAAQFLATLTQIAHLGAVIGRFVETQRSNLLIRQRQLEAVAKGDQRCGVEFLLLVGGHLALPGLPHAEAFFGLRQNHRRLAFVQAGGAIGRIDLDHVMTTALETVDLLVTEVANQRSQGFVLAEEMLAVIATIFGGKGLELPIDRLRQRSHQRAVLVPGQQYIPVRAPDQLDHVPPGAAEQGFEFINDPAVAAHRPVQALQVAVDHPGQVVEALAGGQRQCRHAFRFVHFTVAEHAPDMTVRGVLQAAMLQITHKAGMENRADRANAHGAGRELPEIRHQPRMGVAGQALGAGLACGYFLTVMFKIDFAQTPLKKGPGVDPRRRVRLVEHQVAVEAVTAGTEEVIETHLEQIRRTGVAGDMATQFAISLIGPHHHSQRIPAHDRSQPFFSGEVAWKTRLLLHTDTVDVGRVVLRLPTNCRITAQLCQHVEHGSGHLRPIIGHQ